MGVGSGGGREGERHLWLNATWGDGGGGGGDGVWCPEGSRGAGGGGGGVGGGDGGERRGRNGGLRSHRTEETLTNFGIEPARRQSGDELFLCCHCLGV